jgi:hypothetical protein
MRQIPADIESFRLRTDFKVAEVREPPKNAEIGTVVTPVVVSEPPIVLFGAPYEPLGPLFVPQVRISDVLPVTLFASSALSSKVIVGDPPLQPAMNWM